MPAWMQVVEHQNYAYMDVGSRAPTLGALGDAGAVAEKASK